jgi:ornithine--oxo-acid transaminase
MTTIDMTNATELTEMADVADTPGTDPAALERRYAAHTYHPLPVTLVSGEGSWVTDAGGRRYLDLLAAYSAVNFGHANPRLTAVAHAQLDRLTLTSRAFGNDQLGPLCAELAELVGLDAVIPMNTGAEAVESAIKVSRRWAYEVKGVPADQATIITMDGCFHGRTTTIIGFSTDPDAQRGFGPFTPGFRSVPFGDAAAIAAAIDDTTAAVLLEPVQGEAGVVVPPAGYLREVRELCDRAGVLLIADEIQSGLGRTGATLACDHDGVRPDLVLLGKALGGGIVPISAVVGRADVIATLDPGSHGSTFGGNPLACSIAREVVAMVASGEPQAAARRLGAQLESRLGDLATVDPGAITAVRTIGAWAGVDVHPSLGTARSISESLLARGDLVKDTHTHTVRFAPPLTTEPSDLDWALDQLGAVIAAAAAGAAPVG